MIFWTLLPSGLAMRGGASLWKIRADLQNGYADRRNGSAHSLSRSFLDVVLVTNNTKEFKRVPDLKIENWEAMG